MCQAFADAAKVHVLLVEDEPLVNAMMQEILQEAGFEVCAVQSAIEAVEHLIEGDVVDVMFTDIHMPGINGAELARYARKLRPDMEIVYTSGGLLSPDEKVPGSEFVQKPYRPDAVCALLTKVASRAHH